MTKDNSSFASLVAKLNAMGETGETAETHKEIKEIKKAKREKVSTNKNIDAMAQLLESIDESKPNHLLGREKSKTVPSGETDGTTKNTSIGKLVGEDIVDEDLIADLSSQFRDLLSPTTVAEEEPTEAVGEFAEPLYTLQDELGLEDNVLVDELARWMDGQDIKEFVDSFRRHRDMDPIGKPKRGHWPDDEKSEGKKTDHDGDGDVDSDDYMAAKDKAIKKSMNKKEDK